MLNMLLVEDVTFAVPALLDACGMIRERVSSIASELPFTPSDLDGIRQAVGEAASNAVRHGCKGRPWAEVVVRCRVDDDELAISISDSGPGFQPEAVPEPNFADLPEGGMGIFYMRQLMDRVEFSFHGGTTVTLAKRFPR